MKKLGILSIDQGTTSSRAIVFELDGHQVANVQQEFNQHYPANGWVEHKSEDLWQTTLDSCKNAIAQAQEKCVEIACIAITNQRETTLVWNKETGKTIYPAIVWQDRRTASYCESISEHQDLVRSKTGLLLDPYFSASKIKWILDEVEGARHLANQGKLAFGTVDSFLIWRLTNGKSHVTDATNASRTNLFNIHTQQWDPELLELFTIPKSMLPEVLDCADNFGISDKRVLGEAIPICGVVGDQQAALIGQSCFNPGDLKSTYGTGCFALMNTGNKPVLSEYKLLTTVGYRLKGETTYALEGAIFTAGANIQWLRDGIKVLKHAKQSQVLAESLDYDHGVFLVPGFAGLGAPHWHPHARASLFGMTRGTGPAHFARAALEAVCYQTHELLCAMNKDGMPSSAVWVDGGMVANDWLCQFLADIIQVEVKRPKIMESTALGAAYLAGLQYGLYKDLDDIASCKTVDRTFTPELGDHTRTRLLNKWNLAVEATLAFAE
ncbi:MULTISPECIES: glycerol kinase GlpK [Aliiglaciecola]|uniref:glycerol kinase GlpK n=1 Tax=Aliiglaciecola TaxID=1406885 RepID=UPI001C09D2DE|nr:MULTISPECIES: glycerol kinase GlpK [Aliiglaciecola]MBU2876679.1 glycerol kinase GlpK [Aliiglaciecola lipolytica]MDO6710270.1 glycerol kinase GlpK [Aliiglaciecola sp. 2_MG-2023]MDO6751418.1 glycerol kinase GlpK [Aliiglaciecola sp. 1_MG-2023]